MPTYNVAAYVKEAIESVLRQTYRDFELLVIDDCSTDETVSVVQGIDDPRIRIVQNEKNVGLALVRFPERHEDCMANMLFACSVIVPTFRMSLYRDHGLHYSTEAFPAEDYRFWAECMRVTKIHNIQETLFHYRMHPTQICTTRREEQQRKVAQVRRYMLDWLSTDFTEEEKQYYTGSFMAPQIASRQDYNERKAFCQKMIEKNRSVGHFDEDALRRRLDKHLRLTLYGAIIDRYFRNGYSLPKFFRYLFGGLALRTGCKYESKFLLKSLLHKKA